MITKYGYKTFLYSILLSALFVVIALLFLSGIGKLVVLTIGILYAIFNINFFRDPERTTPAKDNIIVSPADGKVILIKEVNETRFIKEKATQISIFMSPLNVHVNRIPISGTVDYINYIKGEYLAAFHEKADQLNERAEIGIKSKYGKILFTQVAGTIARRIVYNIETGSQVTMGERFGMIKFGSRVDVLVPSGWLKKINVGDSVKAGESILFEYAND